MSNLEKIYEPYERIARNENERALTLAFSLVAARRTFSMLSKVEVDYFDEIVKYFSEDELALSLLIERSSKNAWEMGSRDILERMKTIALEMGSANLVILEAIVEERGMRLIKSGDEYEAHWLDPFGDDVHVVLTENEADMLKKSVAFREVLKEGELVPLDKTAYLVHVCDFSRKHPERYVEEK